MEGILESQNVKKERKSEVVGIESLAYKRKVQVSGLPEKTNVFELTRFFNQFAPVKHCKLIYKKGTGEFQNFGFVEFSTEAETKLVRNIRYFKFRGYQIEVKEALPARAIENKNATIPIHQNGSNLNRKKVFVDGIPRGTHINDIIKYFNIYAPVENVDFEEDPQTREIQKDHGYITFETEAAANYILKIRFFKYKKALIAAKSALLGEVTENENSTHDVGIQIGGETPDSQKIKETRTFFECSHSHKFTGPCI
nr:hypothetical transcript [Hymenolepis microstoma]